MLPDDVNRRCISSLFNLLLYCFPHQKNIIKNTARLALSVLFDKAIKNVCATFQLL